MPGDREIDFEIELGPRERWQLRAHVVLLAGVERAAATAPRTSAPSGSASRTRCAPGTTARRPWRRPRRARRDVRPDDRRPGRAAHARQRQRRAAPAAGLPWFMALFGRDSLITSYQALPFGPSWPARRCCARRRTRPASTTPADAEPGKILHELRHGELAHFGERPHSPYFGSADSTPLFLVVLDEYERWTGDVATVRELEPAARAALAWIERLRRPRRRRLHRVPTATAARPEVPVLEGLVELHRVSATGRSRAAAARRLRDPGLRLRRPGPDWPRLAREVWGDLALADRLERDAADLRSASTATSGCPTAASTRSRWTATRSRSTLTSNIGHLLWSGIVADERVEAVVAHLLRATHVLRLGHPHARRRAAGLQPDRVPQRHGLAARHRAIAAGLARYGRRAGGHRLALALLDAAEHFAYRLPEVVRRLRPRARPQFPVEYPTACSPQAWAAGAPLLSLQSVLGLQPTPSRGRSASTPRRRPAPSS